ncbi:MAG: hypothetical protein EZS28_044247, partial [Streblomastix strix]
YEIAIMKLKFGEKNVDDEIRIIENQEKEKDYEILKLKDEVEKEKLEKEMQKKSADETEQKIKIFEQQKELQKEQELKKEQEKYQEKELEKEQEQEQQKEQKKEQEKQQEKEKEQRQELKKEYQKEQKKGQEQEKILEKEQEKEKELEKEKEQEKQEIAKIEADLKKLNKTPNFAIHNPEPSDIELSDVDGKMKRISKKLNKYQTVSLTQVLQDGIWSLEAEFENGRGNTGALGIVRDAYIIPAGAFPTDNPYAQHIAFYEGYYWYGGQVYIKGAFAGNNIRFNDNQKVRLEYDSQKGTLIFFVDGKQQPVYISGINQKVRFIVYLYYAGSSCLIRSLKKLGAPTSGHVENEIEVEW